MWGSVKKPKWIGQHRGFVRVDGRSACDCFGLHTNDGSNLPARWAIVSGMLFFKNLRSFATILAFGVCALVTLTVARSAFAFGSFTIKPSTVQEADGRWKLNVEADYGSKPHMGHIPFDFIFVQKVYYENSITDNDPKPVQRRKVMHNQPPQREQMDVAFADARGDLWRKTKFSFSLRRDRGFAAGEYSLTIKRSSDGQTLGRPITLILNGENEVIDRRAIVFTGEKKKPEKEKSADEGTDKTDKKDGEDSHEAEESEDEEHQEAMRSDDDDNSFRGEREAAGPPPVEKGPKSGCGCRVEGAAQRDTSVLWLVAVLVGGCGLVFRRRQRNGG